MGSCGVLSIIFCGTVNLGKVLHKIWGSILRQGSQVLHIFRANELFLGWMTSVAGPVFLASYSCSPSTCSPAQAVLLRKLFRCVSTCERASNE